MTGRGTGMRAMETGRTSLILLPRKEARRVIAEMGGTRC
jgi:hypothetical protein